MTAIHEGAILSGVCCAGYGWEVLHIETSVGSVWGLCKNPECPEYQANIGPFDPYRGVKTIMLNELQPLQPFEAIGKEGARIHLRTGDPRLPDVNGTYVLCGRNVAPGQDWMQMQLSLVDFLQLDGHCINCEMMLRGFTWDRFKLALAASIDWGVVKLNGEE